MNADPRINLLDFDTVRLTAFFEQRGEHSYRAKQVINWVHQRGVADFDGMTNISKQLRERLCADTEFRFPEIVTERVSTDGTRKWLIKLQSGGCIETVFIPENGRGTLCVSSQVGCPLDCQFCATAKQGFNRNLTVGEIIGQVWLAARQLGQNSKNARHITNIVLMGMGEPLLNFDNVVDAMRIMMDDHAYGLSRKRVTLSTAGIIPGIDRLRNTCPVSLAVSLHAPNDELRNEIVPINKKYPIEELMAACRRYVEINPQDQITFEYVMLAGINDDPRLARDLVRILSGLPAKVNLIPFNHFSGSRFGRPQDPVVDRFRDELIRKGIITITRKTRGEDISAACGQLVGKFIARGSRHRRSSQQMEVGHVSG